MTRSEVPSARIRNSCSRTRTRSWAVRSSVMSVSVTTDPHVPRSLSRVTGSALTLSQVLPRPVDSIPRMTSRTGTREAIERVEG